MTRAFRSSVAKNSIVTQMPDYCMRKLLGICALLMATYGILDQTLSAQSVISSPNHARGDGYEVVVLEAYLLTPAKAKEPTYKVRFKYLFEHQPTVTIKGLGK